MTGQASDDRIVASVRAEDHTSAREAFDAVYRAYFPQLWRVAYRALGSSDAASDVVQDVFVTLWTQRAAWAVRTSVRAYLYGAVRNRLASAFRHDGTVTNAAELARAAQSSLGVAGPAPTPDEQLDRTDRANAVAAAIQALPERQRLALTLWLDELTLAEAADVMGVSTVAVWKLVTKARAAVVAALAPYAGDGG